MSDWMNGCWQYANLNIEERNEEEKKPQLIVREYMANGIGV